MVARNRPVTPAPSRDTQVRSEVEKVKVPTSSESQRLQLTIESWLTGLINHMREANLADHRVNLRVGEIKMLYKDLPDEQRRAKQKVDYDLNDALDSYRHHCSEVQRYAAAIQSLHAGQAVLAKLPTV